MSLIETTLFLLLAVVVSGSVARITRIALPLVQIALGAAIVLVTGRTVDLQPDIFFLLFLPPLLFLDGWRFPKEDLFRDGETILELALGLVIFTVVGLGLLIWWMIPEMPLAVAFALAAILSPTDPVAVQAIAARVPMPKRMMRILEGESLLNDATGLTCMRLAIAAATTGTFALGEAVAAFTWLAITGVAVGVGVTFAIISTKTWITRRWGEDVGAQILISLLIPFAAYAGAEAIGGSGILAAVAAGVTMSFAERGVTSGQSLATTRIRRAVVWDTVQFVANGLIFVILGQQMPSIMARAAEVVAGTSRPEVWWLAIYVAAIVVTLAALRFIWVWTSLRFSLFRRRRGPPPKIGLRLTMVMSLAGVQSGDLPCGRGDHRLAGRRHPGPAAAPQEYRTAARTLDRSGRRSRPDRGGGSGAEGHRLHLAYPGHRQGQSGPLFRHRQPADVPVPPPDRGPFARRRRRRGTAEAGRRHRTTAASCRPGRRTRGTQPPDAGPRPE